MTNKNDFDFSDQTKTYDDIESLNNDLLQSETDLLPEINQDLLEGANNDETVSSKQNTNQIGNFNNTSNKNQNNEEISADGIVIQRSKLILMKQLIENIKESSDKLSQLLSVYDLDENVKHITIGQLSEEKIIKPREETAKIIEGVFDGEKMIGPDGKQYSVPANYASKSKLVEGDILKLTITKDGTFVYKQIGPIERRRVVGTLNKEEDGAYYVSANNKKWRVLTASVTYFKGKPGDEAVILIPKTGESKWAAVENIISKIS